MVPFPKPSPPVLGGSSETPPPEVETPTSPSGNEGGMASNIRCHDEPPRHFVGGGVHNALINCRPFLRTLAASPDSEPR